MPGFNGTGPRGMGSGTGWGRGPCGAGRRNGCFGGRGWGWNAAPYAAPYGEPNPAETGAQADLSSQVQALQSQLQALEKHLEELKGNQGS